MSFPTVRVQFMPGVAPFDVPTGTWQDLPPLVHPDGRTEPGSKRPMVLSWDTGRRNELERFSSCAGNVVLRNHDRKLDPEHTTGPYYGQLNPRVPVRFQLDTGTGYVDAYYGFVEGGWQQTPQKPRSLLCELDLRDLLGVLESVKLPQTAYDYEVLQDTPKAFWKLDEDGGYQMFDSSGNGNHGYKDNGEPADAIVIGGVRGFQAAHLGDNRGRFTGQALPTGAPCTIEAWVKFPRDLSVTHMITRTLRDSTASTGVSVKVETSANGSPNGELVVQWVQLGGEYKVRGSTRIDDDMSHHVAVTVASPGTAASDVKLYVDGVEETKTTISGTTPAAWPSHYWWTVGNSWDLKRGDYGLGGIIDETAIYNTALSAARILAHYNAGATAFDGELSNVRVNRVLDIIGLPSGMRDIGTGDTTVGPATYDADSVAAYLDKVVESEQGYLFVDHRGGGKLKFRGRFDRFTATRSLTSQATFTDNPSGYRYRPDIAPDPNSVETIVNTVDVSWRGGTETVTDPNSVDAYGSQARSLNTEAPTASAANSAGLWLIARYKNPRPRIRRIPLGPGGAQAGLPAVATDVRTSDRVTVQRTPNRVGAKIVNDLIVEGTHHELNSDRSWYAQAFTSNADTTQVWIWGTSTWGQTTIWG